MLVWVGSDDDVVATAGDDVVEAGTEVELDVDVEVEDDIVWPSAKMVPNTGVRREEVLLQQLPS